jgi:hypothetical protein
LRTSIIGTFGQAKKVYSLVDEANTRTNSSKVGEGDSVSQKQRGEEKMGEWRRKPRGVTVEREGHFR